MMSKNWRRRKKRRKRRRKRRKRRERRERKGKRFRKIRLNRRKRTRRRLTINTRITQLPRSELPMKCIPAEKEINLSWFEDILFTDLLRICCTSGCHIPTGPV